MKIAFTFFPAGLCTVGRDTRPQHWSLTISQLLLLFFCLAMTGTGQAQQLDPIPPTAGVPIENRILQLRERGHHQPPPPAGGFWVVEDQPGRKRPAIISYYTDRQQLLRADTLPNSRLNIRRRAVVNRLNKRLSQLLDTYPPTVLATRQQTP